MEYTDVLTGQADDLQLTLEDRDGYVGGVVSRTKVLRSLLLS